MRRLLGRAMAAACLAGALVGRKCEAFQRERRIRPPGQAFTPSIHALARTPHCRLCGRKDSEDEDLPSLDEDEQKPKSYTSRELFEKEEQASRKTMNNLLLPSRLNDAVTATLYGLVILGLVLNIFGYDYYLKDGQFVIDTLENRQFENEVRRAMRTPRTYTGNEIQRPEG